MPKPHRVLLVALLALVCVGLSSAVEVQYWTQSTAADHADAARDNTVVTSYGAVELGRGLTPLAQGLDGVAVTNAVAEAGDGTVYAATGPSGVLLRVRGTSAERVQIEGATNLLCLLPEVDGSLLVGTGGDSGTVLRVRFDGDRAKVETVFEAEGVKYVWKLARHADGTLYVATGPTATLYSVDPKGESRELFTAAGENNLESLAVGEGDTLYVGTDPNGLVWQVDRKSGRGRVLFDAGEPEVTALVLDGEHLYAAGALRAESAGDEGEVGAGRPDVDDGEGPIGPAAVEPPREPDLQPGEPDRLPMGDFAQDAPDQDLPPADDLPKAGVAARGADAGDDGRPAAGLPADGFAGDGSAIYRIDLNTGLVDGVLRDPSLFLDLVRQDGQFLVAAGAPEDGRSRLLRFDPASQETAVVAEPDAAQVTALLATKDGRVVMGLANPGGLAVAGRGYAAEGTLESAVLDAGAVSTFGTMRLDGRVPSGTELLVSVRGGSTQDPDVNPGGWGDWSEPTPARRYLQLGAPPSRFLQYKLVLKSNGKATPNVDGVRIAYESPNLPPQVASVEVASELDGLTPVELAEQTLKSGTGPSELRAVTWSASDPNGDPLTFDVLVRKDRRGDFVRVAEKVTDEGYAWDARTTGEGVYEVRVVASDAGGNPPGRGLTGTRVSRPFEVDLTPPVIGDIEATRDVVKLRVADARGTVVRLEYCVNADPAKAESWIRAFPEDNMADSPQERYALRPAGLPAGPATLRLRAVDDSGNVAFASVALPAAEQ